MSSQAASTREDRGLGRVCLVWLIAAMVCSCLLASAARARTIDLRTPTDIAYLGPAKGLAAWPVALAFSPDGKLFAIANRRVNSISMFSTTTDGILHQVPGSPFHTYSGPQSVAFSPNGKLLAVANTGDDAIAEYLVGADGTLKRAPDSPLEGNGVDPHQLAFTPNGQLLVSDNNNGTLSIFSVGADGMLAQVDGSPFGGAGGNWMAISPDGRLIATVGGSALSLFQLASGGPQVSLVRVPGTPVSTGGVAATSVAFNPAGSLIAIGNTRPFSVSMFYVLTDFTTPIKVQGSPFDNVATPNASWGDLSSVSFSPDGSLLGATTLFRKYEFTNNSVVTLFSVGSMGKLTNTGTSLLLWGDPALGSAPAAFSPVGGLVAAVTGAPVAGVPQVVSTFNLRGRPRPLNSVGGGTPTPHRRRFSLSGVRPGTDVP
ncbi:MAG: WD40 repeat domain-containing protein [Solirubrobacteraceae bacterium]